MEKPSRRLAVALAAAALLLPAPAYAERAPAAVVEVDTRDELLAALAGATAGDTVFVTGTASINLTGYKTINIPAGVTLASDRGQGGSPGALLYNTELDLDQRESWEQFRASGAGTRITGLRLRGPDTEIRDSAYQYDNSRGIWARQSSDLVVENNELYGWSHGAVYLDDAIDTWVTRNNIHHNRRTGLGYGVVLYRHSSAVIQFNTFTQNRHAIAGSGLRTQRYDARYNLVVDNARSHGFDMHGEWETQEGGGPYAGDVMYVTNNSFRSAAQTAYAVRGRPLTRASVAGNCFAHSSQSAAVSQNQTYPGNLFFGSNTYGTTSGTCHVQGSRRLGTWQLSDGGTSSWREIAPYTYNVEELGFGDFDGDGRTDVLRATGARWYYSPGGTGRWVPRATSGATRHDFGFGDFDGDGRTDVFDSDDGRWQFSSAANGSWQQLNTSNYDVDSLRFGDFDGDERTDVFRTDGSQWYVSSGGTAAWRPLATSGKALSELGFGDFDGDGRTDVFTHTGDRWYFSSGGVSSWQPLAAAGVLASALRYADIDGDGTTDVFRTDGSRWYFSSGARESWAPLASSSCAFTSLAVADFTGDGKADVFGGRC
jgi:hypothetical protein